ncbi:hypothetical protein BJ875DRAFT_82768 [Amylocarpus encephaloides]|uniref:Tyrosinase copper-binding domain-containing protein n=1 Tax=Amylocarpus encephaloides TaxID=45428 RepID=A0A9P8C395_9HELO|nr:hypothetical protein BJ875DRAFT_82768 [Amylocarpus encephaloides]
MRFSSSTRSILSTFVSGLLIQSTHSVPTTAPSASDFKRYDYGVEGHNFIKRQTGFIPATGVHIGSGPAGSAPQRLEIRELEKDKTMWTLYILGLDMLQNVDQSDMQSWYQIMGIHGRPYLPFDHVQASSPANAQHGYCTHGSLLFPTWHRPYLALYEQVLHGLIQQIANYYPEGPIKDQYVAAAPNFRTPYWDWAAAQGAGASVYPSSVGGSPGIDIDGPAGTQLIANPLYSYVFQPRDPQELPDRPFNTWQQTLRYPTSTAANAVSQNNLVAQQLDNSASMFRSRLYNLLTNSHDYSSFSNEGLVQGGGNVGFESIESIHNSIHGLTGSGGHMNFVDYSAFDPLFMLHHTMVDRAFALWQAINPDSYVPDRASRIATFTISTGEVVGATTPLKPFRNAAGDFWDSNGIQDTKTFGYTYPETANSTGANIPANVVFAVNKLYGPNSAGSPLARIGNRAALDDTVDSIIPRNTADGVAYREWIANIQVQKHALSGPFFIHIFLGPFNPDPFKWSFEPNLVGTHSIFDKTFSTLATQTFCNCTDDAVTGTVPLTDALGNALAENKIKSLDVADVEPYLKANLRYKLSYLDDTEVASGLVPSLEINVVSAAVKKAATDIELPQWGKLEGQLEVVRG